MDLDALIRTALNSLLPRLRLIPDSVQLTPTAMTTSDTNELPVEPNPLLIAKALSIISGKWRLYSMLVLGEQTLRFSQLAEQLPGVSEKVLAHELKALVSLGVMLRTVHAEIPPRVEYTLTQKARSALPLLRQIQQIGQLIA